MEGSTLSITPHQNKNARELCVTRLDEEPNEKVRYAKGMARTLTIKDLYGVGVLTAVKTRESEAEVRIVPTTVAEAEDPEGVNNGDNKWTTYSKL